MNRRVYIDMVLFAVSLTLFILSKIMWGFNVVTVLNLLAVPVNAVSCFISFEPTNASDKEEV